MSRERNSKLRIIYLFVRKESWQVGVSADRQARCIALPLPAGQLFPPPPPPPASSPSPQLPSRRDDLLTLSHRAGPYGPRRHDYFPPTHRAGGRLADSGDSINRVRGLAAGLRANWDPPPGISGRPLTRRQSASVGGNRVSVNAAINGGIVEHQ